MARNMREPNDHASQQGFGETGDAEYCMENNCNQKMYNVKALGDRQLKTPEHSYSALL